MQKTYRLDPKQLEKQKKNIVLLYGIAGIISGGLMFYSQSRNNAGNNPWLLIGLMLALLVFFGYRSYKQRAQLWDGYLLTLNEEGLTQSQPDYPESHLPFAKISSVEEGKDGLWISTAQGNRVFIIPIFLKPEDYSELTTIVREKLPLAPDEEANPDDEDLE